MVIDAKIAIFLWKQIYASEKLQTVSLNEQAVTI